MQKYVNERSAGIHVFFIHHARLIQRSVFFNSLLCV